MTNHSNHDPRWVIVGAGDDVHAGPFPTDAHDDVMAAADTHQKRDWDRIRVITVSHLREIQDEYLGDIQYYRRTESELAPTKIVARTDTQFAAVQVTESGDVRPLTFRYREFERDHDSLTRLEATEVGALDWSVKQRLRHGLLVKERKAQGELRQAYLDGKPVESEAAWNPLVEASVKMDVLSNAAEAE